MTTYSAEEWNALIRSLPGAHILQTWEWGQFKAATGWQMLPQVWRDEQGQVRAAAMVLRRTALRGVNILYAPRGPLVDWNDPVWSRKVIADLEALARKEHAIFIKMDPELVLGTGVPGTADEQPNPVGMNLLEEIGQRGWRLSDEQVQFRNTAFLDLNGSEADWLARMKPKARYNLRLSQRKGVEVRQGSPADLPALYHMYAETSVRDGFVIRGESYYLALWQQFMQVGMAAPLIAEAAGQPVAAILLFFFAGRAWYLHGMSTQLHREFMPNYLLQWEAMRLAKAHGCTSYDLWGAPDVFDESDSMWGVFRFKEGLGGQVVRTAGAWDFPTQPLFYRLYTQTLPRVLSVMRRRGKAQTRQEVAA